MPEYVSSRKSRRARRRLTRLKNRKVRRCRMCGCTDSSACLTVEGPCYWVADDLCSNPDCLSKVTVSLVVGDEVLRAG